MSFVVLPMRKNKIDYRRLNKLIEEGHIIKQLTFNIYDDNMRNAAISLFRLLNDYDDNDFMKLREWAIENVNTHMFDYVWRLINLYKNDITIKEQEPPFVTKPNYFINTETIRKALQLKLKDGQFSSLEGKVNQYFKINDNIAINTNYSGWNLPSNGCEEQLDYFREDIALNSYNYGVHFMHPFWMSNDELDVFNGRHAEHYYYIHQQLLARYNLEKQHLKEKNVSMTPNCVSDYNPYLTYDNGLPFPIRSSVLGDWNDNQARIKSIDIAIKECISRGVIFMENGTKISMTEDNYVDLLTKLIRANFDGVRNAKMIKSVFGYGGNGYTIEGYNPAPSLLHHPETSLRDPIYWYLIQFLLNYFTEYSTSLKPFDLSPHLTTEFKIIESDFTKITTYFDYYQVNINKAIEDEQFNYKGTPLTFTARQKRLKHLPFTLNFTVESKTTRNSIVRLFLGPPCSEANCWNQSHRFFELDSFMYGLVEGINIISWSPETSPRFSFDDYFNLELKTTKKNKFNLFKFPENMLIPRGSENGMHLTLFIMITPADNISQTDFIVDRIMYRHFSNEVDTKPLGFPFHRKVNFPEGADYNNCNFFNITIFHKKGTVDNSGFFSPHLY
ncbi:arylphorin subunit alpha-like isoform X2 [Epargyreus clarus]|uniref:arylphorin subunit alpha-like isoform X2 n=1 Tax=Epargyreus clarus TaxID=520877 RepID=UPI003C2C11DE